MKLRIVAPLAVVTVLLAACASSDDSPAVPGSTEGSMSTMPGMDDSMTFTFGEPGDPDSADRTVDVKLLDELRFDPAEIDVEVGETVTFVVTNDGQAPHEFVLGGEDVQDEHEMEMADMGGGLPMDEPNAIALSAGETKSLTWTFTEPGQILYGCHVPGHYLGGMVGTITVEE